MLRLDTAPLSVKGEVLWETLCLPFRRGVSFRESPCFFIGLMPFLWA